MDCGIKFTINGEPYGKKNLKPMVIGGHARAYSPKENNFYMDRIIGILNELTKDQEEQFLFPKETPVYVMIEAFFKVPDTHYKYYKKEKCSRYDKTGQDMLQGKIRPTKKPDLDNISKVICDGISHQGRIWYDDSQVVSECIVKHYSRQPRVEVVISKVFTENLV